MKNNYIGENIRTYRARANLTQQQLADKVGVSWEMISRYERQEFSFLNILYKISIFGQCKIISLPCCVHLFGNYDFLIALLYKDRLEMRFTYMDEIDTELLTWLKNSYFLKL